MGAPHDAVARQAWAQGGGAPTTPQALNRYAYAQNAPLRFTDPTGHWIERAVDIACIADDIWDITQNGLTWNNGLALAADVGGLLLPGLTGLGMAVRGGRAAVEAASHSDEVVDAARAVAKAAGHADDAADASRAATQGGEAVAGAARTAAQGGEAADAAQTAAQGGEAVETISSYHLYFSQKGISWSTRSGVPLDDLAQDIAQRWRGKPLRVVELEGKLVSLDNRRLAAAKLIGADVPIRRVSPEVPEIAKLVFQRDGVQSSVLVRGTNLRIDVSGRVFEQ